jgi:ketosteroid isomerase-like protein
MSDVERAVRDGFAAFKSGEIERLFPDAAEDIVITQRPTSRLRLRTS